MSTFVLLVCAAGTAYSQTGSHSANPEFQTGRIVGQVYDNESRDPLVGGMVLIEGTNLGNVTTDDGSFFVDYVPAGSYTISAEYLGYGTVRRGVSIEPGQTVTMDFGLPSEVVLANAITAVIEKEPIPVPKPDKSYSVTTEVQVHVPDALPEESCRALVSIHGSYIVDGRWQLAASVGRLLCGEQEIECRPVVVYKDQAENRRQAAEKEAAGEPEAAPQSGPEAAPQSGGETAEPAPARDTALN